MYTYIAVLVESSPKCWVVGRWDSLHMVGNSPKKEFSNSLFIVKPSQSDVMFTCLIVAGIISTMGELHSYGNMVAEKTLILMKDFPVHITQKNQNNGTRTCPLEEIYIYMLYIISPNSHPCKLILDFIGILLSCRVFG